MRCAWALASALAAMVWCAGAPAGAQESGFVSPILTLDQERLFEGSGVTARISAEIERLSQELAEENRKIETALVAEELELTERRPTLQPDEFRALADAFDEKVQTLRGEQDAKALELQRLRDEERQNFLRQITPVLAAIVREKGALIVIDRRAAILSADAIDITAEAIARVNAALDGTDEAPAPLSPEQVFPLSPPLEAPDTDSDPGTAPSEP